MINTPTKSRICKGSTRRSSSKVGKMTINPQIIAKNYPQKANDLLSSSDIVANENPFTKFAAKKENVPPDCSMINQSTSTSQPSTGIATVASKNTVTETLHTAKSHDMRNATLVAEKPSRNTALKNDLHKSKKSTDDNIKKNASNASNPQHQLAEKPAGKAKLSKAAQATRDKWQKEAKKVGGPNARIIVSKADAKMLIFQTLHDSFCPMTIILIYNKLQAVVPSPVLRACLDEMIASNALDGFNDSSDEDERTKKPTKPTKSEEQSNDPFHDSLVMKPTKSANNPLYYADYTRLSNNGDGLAPEARNKLLNKVMNAKAEEERHRANLQQMTSDTTKLLGEPKNDQAATLLTKGEAALAMLHEQAQGARKLKANEKHKQQTKKRIDSMTAEWRKRKRICNDFLMALEENSDGAISRKKILACDGQFDVESDEMAAQNAIAYAKRVQSRPSMRRVTSAGGSSCTVAPTQSFVAVTLDSQGCVSRIHLDAIE